MKDIEKLQAEATGISKIINEMRSLCDTEDRDPTTAEIEKANKLLDRQDEIRSLIKEHENSNYDDKTLRAVFGQPGDFPGAGTAGISDRRDIKGYELRGPTDKKDYRSLYGSRPLNDYTWRDKEISFWQAVFSGRMHPELTTRGMVEGVGASGGFLVPQEQSSLIHNVALEGEIVQPLAFVQPMKTDQIKIPATTIGSHSSNLFGGFVAYYRGETAALTEANPKVRAMELNTDKLTGYIQMSNELAADMPGGENSIVQICGSGLGWYRDKAFLKGSGAGEPLGVLNASCLIAVTKETGQAASSIVYQNLTSMMSRMHPACFKNSVWICHQTTIPQLLELTIPVGTGGTVYPVLRETDGSFSMLTRPVIFTEKTETLGTQGDILLADFGQYVIGMREEMRIDYSIHVAFSTDELVARLIERHCGQPLWNETLTLEDGTTTVSPFVTLQDRS
jgi:HK97 family phage major capsid protein